MIGLKGHLYTPMQRTDAEMGLTQTGVTFRMGPTSIKQSKLQNTKKTKGGGLRKNKENKVLTGKENVSGRERTQTQGDGNNLDMTMEIDLAEMGAKRRIRSPLSELDNMEDNGKQVREEGEVKEFGRILAQHLGSVEVDNQPHRAQ